MWSILLLLLLFAIQAMHYSMLSANDKLTLRRAQLERELRSVVETTGEAPPDATAASMGTGMGINGMEVK